MVETDLEKWEREYPNMKKLERETLLFNIACFLYGYLLLFRIIRILGNFFLEPVIKFLDRILLDYVLWYLVKAVIVCLEHLTGEIGGIICLFFGGSFLRTP